MTALASYDIARRIVSRFRKLASGYTSGAFSDDLNTAFVSFTASDGRLYRAYVSMMAASFTRPVGFDHIIGKRPPIDQLRLAEYASKAVGALARVSNDDADVAELDVWHKNGTAGFIVRSTAGVRFVVEVREIDVDEQLEEARRAVAAKNDIATCVRCGNTDNDGSDICPDCGDHMVSDLDDDP
jgi:hypothetical protein